MNRRQALQQLGTLASTAWLLPHTAGAAATSILTQTAPSPEGRPGERPIRSTSTPGIFLNQLGYLPKHSKVASVANLPEGTRSFRVLRLSGHEAFQAELGKPKLDAASGDTISLADFSSLTVPGTYSIEAGGIKSDLFSIAPDAYQHALYLSTRAFYGQRCGCEVDLGDGYRHAVCHKDGAYHPTSGRSGPARHLGGWHDAGDYGRYVVNSGISTATLLYAFELFPRTLTGFKLDLPGKHTMPDILNEVQWNLDWMISLEDDRSEGSGGKKAGGVWHKQTSEEFCAFIMPEKDTLTSYIIGSGHEPWKTTGATADLAGTAAIAARVYKPFDRAYAEHCLAVARSAWEWAVANPAQPYSNPPSIKTGEYGDHAVTNEIVWAAAELFRTTGEPQYEQYFLAAVKAHGEALPISEPGWGNLFSFGCWSYVLSASGSAAVKEQIRSATREAAQRLIDRSDVSGYANTLTEEEYGWGSNGTVGNQSILLLMDDLFQPNARGREVALNNLHYLLGRNCHGVSWVTHLGTRPFMHPHHRPSVADGIAAPWPGLLSGGPNRHPADEAARTLPAMPPMRMWLDDERAYSMNEIAINWNAPLVFLLTAANSFS